MKDTEEGKIGGRKDTEEGYRWKERYRGRKDTREGKVQRKERNRLQTRKWKEGKIQRKER